MALDLTEPGVPSGSLMAPDEIKLSECRLYAIKESRVVVEE